jgi:NAD(P)-dependent dehydrogenase (short-subunit alcohol dehydrogenase family)
MKRLDSKVILVAGAGNIGNECARRYASEGASVVLGDIRVDVAEEAVREIRDAGGRAEAVPLDGADEASIQSAVALACDRFGGLDGLHANFACVLEGRSTTTTVLDIPLDMYDQIMHVNARGFMLCTRHALPPIIARGGGAITYTSSGAATSGSETRFAYAMSKAAGQSLMRHVATRFGADGVRANAIAPGVVDRATLMPDAREMAIKGNKIKRLGRATDIASIAALLMSDEGSYITGQVINVDGGITMRP